MKPESIDFTDEIGWFEYQVRLVAGAFRPVDMYYEAPTLRDALGYYHSKHNCSDDDN
jgi:hypothetical protein